MSGMIRLKTTGDNKGVVDLIDQLQKKVGSLEKQLTKTSAKSKQLTAEERALAREAKKVFEEVQSPAERYKAKLNQLSQLLKSGKIDSETYGRAAVKAKANMIAAEQRLQQELTDTAGKTRQLTAEERKLAKEAKDAYEKTLTPMQRYQAKLNMLDAALKRGIITRQQYNAAVAKSKAELDHAGTSLRTSARAHDSTFGTAAIQSLGQYALGVGSISAALAKAVELFRALDQEAQEAFERINESKAGMAELAGLARTPEEAKAFVDTARKAYDQGVGRTEEEAAGLHYKLQSTGLYNDRKVFEELAKTGAVRDVMPTVGATAKIQAAMGTEETGDATAVVSKLYAASDATQYTMPQIAKAAAEPALFGAKLGMSDEGVLAQITGALQTLDVSKVDSGARAYYQALAQRGGFEGLNATEQITAVQERTAPMDAEDRTKFFGSIEAQTFFEALTTQRGQQVFQEQLVALPEAERTQLALTKAQLPDVDPALRKARLAELAERKKEAEDRDEGEQRALTQAILDERQARTKREHGNALAYIERGAMTTGRMFLGDEFVEQEASHDPLLSSELREEVGPARGTLLRRRVSQAAQAYDASRWATQPMTKANEFFAGRAAKLFGFGAKDGEDTNQEPARRPPESIPQRAMVPMPVAAQGEQRLPGVIPASGLDMPGNVALPIPFRPEAGPAVGQPVPGPMAERSGVGSGQQPIPAAVNTTTLETETREQTRVVRSGNDAIVEAIEGLRQDLQQDREGRQQPTHNPNRRMPTNTAFVNLIQ